MNRKEILQLLIEIIKEAKQLKDMYKIDPYLFNLEWAVNSILSSDRIKELQKDIENDPN